VIALDVVENQHYITKWVEDTVINGVKSIKGEYYKEIQKVEYTIQYGVKHTSNRRLVVSKDIEDTIQNGVKRTLQKNINRIGQVEDAIKNGVKRTIADDIRMGWPIIEDTIQNGVKHTQGSIFDNPTTVKDTIQNGVKRTDFNIYIANNRVEDAIQNGVKKTYSDKIPHEYDWSNQFTEEIDDIIQNGVKHTEKSLQIDGSCVIEDVIKEGVKHTEYGDWLDGDERFDDIIENGVKKTTPGGYLGSVERKGKMVHQFEHSKQDDNVEDVIKSGIKATTTNLPLSQDDGQIAEIEDVIKNGIKKTEAAALFDEELKMDTVISNGIKETIPVVPGDILDTIDFMSYNNTTNVQHLISDVIEKGIKETHDDVMPHTGRVEGVIKNGVKKTVDALSSRLPNPVEDIIKNGVKQCIPSHIPLYNLMDFSVQYRENHRLDDVASVLEKGIKEVQPLPSQEGNMDYSNYYYRQGDRTKPHTQYVNDVITNGIKKTEAAAFRIVDSVISNGKIIK
jgi:predicted peroxiredoxin